MEFHMKDIIYVALPKQKRRHFHAKMIRANLYMYIGVGQGSCKKSRPYPARAYTTIVVLVGIKGTRGMGAASELIQNQTF